MIKLQATSATQPTVPPTAQTAPPVQTQAAPAKPSFKGHNDDSHDMWKKNKEDFESMSNDSASPSFIKKASKAGIVLATGVLGYGTAKFGMNKCSELISSMIKSKPVQNLKAKIGGFTTETVIPQAKKAFNAIKESVISKKMSAKVDSAMTGAKESKMGKAAGEKLDAAKVKFSDFAQNEKMVKITNFAKSIKTKMAALVETIKSKMPTMAQIKGGAIETLAVGSGMAAAMTGANFERAHEEA